jgi:hypothetical protein
MVNWIVELLSVYSWGVCQLKRNINVIISLQESIVSIDVIIFKSPPYFSFPKTSLQGEMGNEENSSTNPLLAPSTLPKQDVPEYDGRQS